MVCASIGCLVESFFEHDGQAVCARCKQQAIAAEPVIP